MIDQGNASRSFDAANVGGTFFKAVRIFLSCMMLFEIAVVPRNQSVGSSVADLAAPTA